MSTQASMSPGATMPAESTPRSPTVPSVGSPPRSILRSGATWEPVPPRAAKQLRWLSQGDFSMTRSALRPALAGILMTISIGLVLRESERRANAQPPVYPQTQTLYPYKCPFPGWGLCPDCDDGGDFACESPCPCGGLCQGWSKSNLCNWEPENPSAPTCEQTAYDCGHYLNCAIPWEPVEDHCQWDYWCK